MVAIIKSGASLRNILNYNENKVKQDVAQLIHSMNFGKDAGELSFTDKLKTLEKLASLNERTKLKAIHISLNFDSSEKISKEVLQQIASTYMNEIGFGGQPYLVYRHHDAGHPHIHIISTNIQRDGKRIPMQNIGRNLSEPARKKIEREFKLMQAHKAEQKIQYELKPVSVQKLQYGKSETKRAITNVLDKILPIYKYASLPELNAVLRQYNVIADRGSENSRTYKANGLVYRALNDEGQKVGAPVKASSIYSKPTLKYLHERFSQNEVDRQKHKLRVKNAVDLYLIRNPGKSLDALQKHLQGEGIQVVLRQNEQRIIYGMTYIDYQTKCVFNGSDLGKQYSANQVQERCRQDVTVDNKKVLKQELALIPGAKEHLTINTSDSAAGISNVIDRLVQQEQAEPLANDLREDEKRRKKKKLRH